MAGGQKDVGTVTAGARQMSFDEKTRPMTRMDMIRFLSDPDKNLRPCEKELIIKSVFFMVSGCTLAGYAGWQLTKRMSFERLVKKGIMPFPAFPKMARLSMTFSLVTIPFMLVQEWATSTLLEMNDMDSVLAFNAKRFLVLERSQMLYSRGEAREVTREEQDALANKAIEQNKGKGHMGAAGKVDVNAALGGQQLLPIAQTGYQPMIGDGHKNK